MSQTHNLPECYFDDAGGKIYKGFDQGTTWNGWSNVSVTPETWEMMLADWAKAGDEGVEDYREEYTKGDNGLVSLGFGLCMSVVTKQEMVEQLSTAFVAQLREVLTAGDFIYMQQRNAVEVNTNICHSHDFCDANVVMEHAWSSVIGFKLDLNCDEHIAIWDKAWSDAAPVIRTVTAAAKAEEFSPAVMSLFKKTVEAWDGYDAELGNPEPEHITCARGIIHGKPLESHGCYVMKGFAVPVMRTGRSWDLYTAPMKTDGTCDHEHWGLVEVFEADFLRDVNALLGTDYDISQFAQAD